MARIQGEPTVPGKIPGGVASRPNTRKGSSNPGRGTGVSWYDSKWCSVPSNTRKGSSIPGRGTVFPGMIPGGVASRLLLFIAGHLFVYSRGCLFTPATSRRRALGWPENACRAVATAFALLMPRLGRRLVLFLSGFLFLQIQDCRWPGLAAKGSRLGQCSGVYQKPSVWACGTGQQRVHNARPLSLGFPSLSIGTSHTMPRRQSREGFGARLLRSR